VTETTFTELRKSAAFDVVGGVGGPQTGSTWLNSATDCTESTKQTSTDFRHQQTVVGEVRRCETV